MEYEDAIYCLKSIYETDNVQGGQDQEALEHAITILERVERLQKMIVEADFGLVVAERETEFGPMSKIEHVNSSFMFVTEFLHGNTDNVLVSNIRNGEEW